MATPELACIYATLILNEDGLEVTSEKLQQIAAAAGGKIDSQWADIYAAYFANHDVAEMIKNTSFGGSAAAAPAAAGAAAAVVEEAKKEEEAAVEVNLGDMFDW